MSCNKCGMCCRAIQVMWTKKRIRELKPVGWEFVVKHWHRIPEELAMQVAPWLVPNSPIDTGNFGRLYFYVCDQFDGHRCLANGRKPPVCADFPFYDGNLKSNHRGGNATIPPECGYEPEKRRRLRNQRRRERYRELHPLTLDFDTGKMKPKEDEKDG